MTNYGNDRGLGRIIMGLGVLLIVLGVLFFVGQVLDVELGRFGWPFFVIVPGILLFVFALAREGRIAELAALFGSVATMAGIILLYQNAVDHFESWAYAWTLVFPTSVGLGRIVYGSLKGQVGMVATGRRLALIGIILFAVGAFFFELVIGISGFGLELGRFGWPVLLVVLGILVLLAGFLFARRRG